MVIAENAPRLPNTLCVAMPGRPADLQVMNLDLVGVMVSAGSACSSGKVKVSHVLAAMGLEDLASSAIRVSGGWDTGQADWQTFVDAWLKLQTRRTSAAA